MKKLLLSTIITLLALSSFAQLKFAAGLKGGVNFSSLNISNSNASGKTGYHAGCFAQFRFSKIAIQPEMIFSQQGSEIDIDSVLKSSYINFPLMIKIYLAAGVNLHLGPQFGFLNKAQLNGRDIKGFFKNADISAGFGVGWDAPFGLMCEARYNLGLTDNSDFYYSYQGKNQVFQVSIGFKIIRIGKK